ncbi:hypothetical protein B5K06_25975 [Rhizobium grahamii]|uniref:Uncharacterized protein n=1 Tax=Rhizobium grahamii TaxID=1120045 RepID=A0A370KI78_9HYPH|nr:hypothetical protein B5K06_25975 [Rhizobium grahamii]
MTGALADMLEIGIIVARMLVFQPVRRGFSVELRTMCNARVRTSEKFRVTESPVYDGKWTVVENSTDCPAIVEGIPWIA